MRCLFHGTACSHRRLLVSIAPSGLSVLFWGATLLAVVNLRESTVTPSAKLVSGDFPQTKAALLAEAGRRGFTVLPPATVRDLSAAMRVPPPSTVMVDESRSLPPEVVSVLDDIMGGAAAMSASAISQSPVNYHDSHVNLGDESDLLDDREVVRRFFRRETGVSRNLSCGYASAGATVLMDAPGNVIALLPNGTRTAAFDHEACGRLAMGAQGLIESEAHACGFAAAGCSTEHLRLLLNPGVPATASGAALLADDREAIRQFVSLGSWRGPTLVSRWLDRGNLALETVDGTLLALLMRGSRTVAVNQRAYLHTGRQAGAITVAAESVGLSVTGRTADELQAMLEQDEAVRQVQVSPLLVAHDPSQPPPRDNAPLPLP
jgi:hypothetical protein